MSDKNKYKNLFTESTSNKAKTSFDAKKAQRTSKIIKIMWASFFGIGLLVFLIFVLIYNGIIGYMPPIEELKNPKDKFASILYASDGTTEVGRYYSGTGNRVYAEYSDISHYLVDALIATEDERFYDHSGIDFWALGRAIVKTGIMGDRSSGGGSTITQQLAKQLYSKPSSNIFERIIQKPIEWMIAVKLERFYTKDEIIKMYLNRFDFLNNAVGIKTAANVYFNKDAKDLTIEESAMLIGMLKNPSYYNPLRFPERVKERRNVVFYQMAKNGYISNSEAESLAQLPLKLDYKHMDHRKLGIPYVREEIRRLMTAKKPKCPNRSDYDTDQEYILAMGKFNTDSTNWQNNPLYGWIEKNPKPDGTNYSIYSDGLRIFTTIDMTMQKYAEEAIYEHLGGYLQPAFDNEKKHSSSGPYTSNRSELSTNALNSLIERAKKDTERYRVMKENGFSAEEIEESFHKPEKMRIFAYTRETFEENGKKVTRIVPGTKEVTMTPYDSLMYMKSILRTGMMSMDPVNGYVKAFIGGPDFTFFQYNMASLGRRQVGSTVKPFLYTLAMEYEYTPCSMFLNAQPVFGNWKPRNSGGGRIGEMVDLRWALTNSNNWISARLIDELKPINLYHEMRLFGITGYIDPTYSLCLGHCDVSVSEMVSAYSAFSNQGIKVDPIIVSRIEDSKGNVLADFVPRKTEVISEDAYYKILSILMNVVNSGTGAGLRSRYGITAEMGGKTGTTNYNADSWFMGFTPDLVTGVWVGGDERYIHFNSMAYGQGARAALPMYGLYMKKVYADPKLGYSQSTKFQFPKDFDPCEGELIIKETSDFSEEEDVPGIFE